MSERLADEYRFDQLDRSSHDEVRDLILAGLKEHWGSIDRTLNPDLDDMLSSYAEGHTVVVRSNSGRIVGTGTIVPRDRATAEIVRMSVDQSTRRSGIGRRIVGALLTTAAKWGTNTVVLETTSAWTDIINFYLSCGFSITHTAESDFGCDTWFKLELDPSEDYSVDPSTGEGCKP